MKFEFVEWQKKPDGCMAIFKDAANNIIASDVHDVQRTYWSQVGKPPANESQPLMGITFEQAKVAMSKLELSHG